MGPAAGLRGPPLAGRRVAVEIAVGLPLGEPSVQDVLDVLHNEVDGHCGAETAQRQRHGQGGAQAQGWWDTQGLEALGRSGNCFCHLLAGHSTSPSPQGAGMASLAGELEQANDAGKWQA